MTMVSTSCDGIGKQVEEGRHRPGGVSDQKRVHVVIWYDVIQIAVFQKGREAKGQLLHKHLFVSWKGQLLPWAEWQKRCWTPSGNVSRRFMLVNSTADSEWRWEETCVIGHVHISVPQWGGHLWRSLIMGKASLFHRMEEWLQCVFFTGETESLASAHPFTHTHTHTPTQPHPHIGLYTLAHTHTQTFPKIYQTAKILPANGSFSSLYRSLHLQLGIGKFWGKISGIPPGKSSSLMMRSSPR